MSNFQLTEEDEEDEGGEGGEEPLAAEAQQVNLPAIPLPIVEPRDGSEEGQI